MTNYFQLYDIPVSFHPDQAVVKQKFYELSRTYHPDRFANAPADELAETLRMAALNNDAYKPLKSPDATMAYILRTANLLEHDEKYALPPAFLMEMMELNEAVSDYEDMPGNDDARLAVLDNLAEHMQAWETAATTLTRRYDAGETDTSLLLQIKDMYFRKKYLTRISERIK
jgi:molecular chaperone HscB